MKKRIEMRMLASLLLMLITMSALAQNYNEFQTAVRTESYFGVGFYEDAVGSPYIYVTVGGGNLQRGDTVEIGTNGRYVTPFYHVIKEELNISETRIEVGIKRKDVDLFTKGGIAYVKVKDEQYWLKKRSIAKTKKMARRAFN